MVTKEQFLNAIDIIEKYKKQCQQEIKTVNEILKTDSNTKYFQSIQRTELDTPVRSVSGIKDKI